jgi:hypothetical protein
MGMEQLVNDLIRIDLYYAPLSRAIPSIASRSVNVTIGKKFAESRTGLFPFRDAHRHYRWKNGLCTVCAGTRSTIPGVRRVYFYQAFRRKRANAGNHYRLTDQSREKYPARSIQQKNTHG